MDVVNEHSNCKKCNRLVRAELMYKVCISVPITLVTGTYYLCKDCEKEMLKWIGVT